MAIGRRNTVAEPGSPEAVEEAARWQIWTTEGLVVADPTAIQGRLLRVPEGLEPRRALMGYDTQRSTGEKVSCAACGHRHNHFHGFVVEFQDGSVALVGIECGERYFGEGAWAKLSAGLEQAKRRALYTSRSAPAVAKIDTILPKLRAWADRAAPLASFVEHVEDEFPALAADLRRAAKGGGTLSREVLALVQRQDARGVGSDRQEYQLRRFGHLPAAELFVSGSAGGHITEAYRLLERAKASLEAEEPTLVSQQAAFALINVAFGALQEAHRKHTAGRQLFSEDVWVTIAKWANANPEREGNYRCKRGRFRLSDRDYDYGEVQIPPATALAPSLWHEIAAEWPKL